MSPINVTSWCSPAYMSAGHAGPVNAVMFHERQYSWERCHEDMDIIRAISGQSRFAHCCKVKSTSGSSLQNLAMTSQISNCLLQHNTDELSAGSQCVAIRFCSGQSNLRRKNSDCSSCQIPKVYCRWLSCSLKICQAKSEHWDTEVKALTSV